MGEHSCCLAVRDYPSFSKSRARRKIFCFAFKTAERKIKVAHLELKELPSMVRFKLFAPVALVCLIAGCAAPHPLTDEEKFEKRQALNDWVACVESREIHEVKQDATDLPQTPAPRCD